MRLTCPNCSAQYEVPDEVIPDGGRDVQCSNCEHTWFQAKAAAPDDTEASPTPTVDEIEEEIHETAAPETPDNLPDKALEDSGHVDPAVASILKEEAAREAELRGREGGNLESQPDLALETAEEPKVKPKRPTASKTASDAGQKEALPDVEAINSGLRGELTSEDTEPPAPVRKSGGFLRGFALVVIVGIILFLIYGNANQISEAVPQADPVLQSYVSIVDQARIWLEAQTGGAQN